MVFFTCCHKKKTSSLFYQKTCDIFALPGIRERRLIDTGSLYLFKFRSTDLSKDGLQQYVVVEI
jgi:hypothetical protein